MEKRIKLNYMIRRYKLKGDICWCLNFKNGWIRIYNYMIRWNTDWTIPHIIFSLTNVTKGYKREQNI